MKLGNFVVMSVKVLKRSRLTKNLLLYLPLCIFFIHIVESLSQGKSALSLAEIFSLVDTHRPLLIFLPFVFTSIFYVKKLSRVLLLLFLGGVFVQSISPFFKEYDKIILLLNFFFIVVSYHFYLFWDLELKDALYRPGFTKNDLVECYPYDLDVTVKTESGKPLKGQLTNWNPGSCFVALDVDNKNSFFFKRPQRVILELTIEGKKFESSGEILTAYYNGLGIKLDKRDKKSYLPSWEDFYAIIDQRGLKPLLKN